MPRIDAATLSRVLFWVLLLALCLLSPNRGLWTPDEPREAEIGREMLLSPGFAPHLNAKPFFEKPPLYYWSLAAAYGATGGPSAAAARAVSGLAALLTLLATYFWARRASGERVAQMAVFMLATSIQFFQCAHWVIMDPLLTLFLTLAYWAGFEQVSKPCASALVAFYASLAMALWTKGLIGLALPAAGFLPFFAVGWKARAHKPFHPLTGGIALALLAALCVAIFYLAEGGRAVHEFLWVNQVLRFIHPRGTGHAQPFYYYVEMVPLVVLPWLAPLVALFTKSFWKMCGEREAPQLRRYLLCVLLGGFVLLSLASTKRGIYLLPLLPPLFILLALAMSEALEERERGVPFWKKVLIWRIHPILLAVWGAGLPVAVLLYTRSPWPSTLNLLVLGVFAGVLGIWWAFGEGSDRAWEIQRLSAVVLCVSALGLAVPLLDAQKDMAPFFLWVDREMPKGDSVPAVGSDETLCGIIPFVTGRSVAELRPEDLPGLLAGPAAPSFVIEQLGASAKGTDFAGSGYALAGEKQFGAGRKIRLWKRG